MIAKQSHTPKHSLAEALFLRLYTEQREAFGRDDRRTLRSLDGLAEAYAVQKTFSQAGMLLWTVTEDDSTAMDRDDSMSWAGNFYSFATEPALGQI